MNDTNPSRGDQTRENLVCAATRIFGQAGFDAASTRAIADAAGANQALINYHFGGKDGLYQAVIAAISDDMESSLVPALDALDSAMPLQGRTAVTAILRLLTTIIDRFTLEQMRDWSRIIAREQQDPTPAFEIIYQRFMSRILATLAALVTGASRAPITQDAARLRATLLIGQVLVFIYAPAATQRFLDWPQLGEKQKQQLLHELEHLVYNQFPEVPE